MSCLPVNHGRTPGASTAEQLLRTGPPFWRNPPFTAGLHTRAMHTLPPLCNSPMQSTILHLGEPENWTVGLFSHVPPTCKLPLPHIPVSTRAGSSRDLPWSWKRAWDIWANTSRVPGAWRAGMGISSAWMSSLCAGSSVEGRDQSLGLSNTPLDTHTLLDLLSGLKGPLKNKWGSHSRVAEMSQLCGRTSWDSTQEVGLGL